MRWLARIYDARGFGILTTIENGAQSGTGEIVARSFDPPVVTPPGVSKTLNLFVRQDKLLIPPRAIIHFWLDTNPVFWGPAVIVPGLTSPGAGPFDKDRDSLERVTVIGGGQLLKDSVVGPRLFEGDTDVATIAYQLCVLYAHPALKVSSLNFPATGAVLSVYFSPERDLYTALTQLADAVPGGASVWVDFSGNVRFEAVT